MKTTYVFPTALLVALLVVGTVALVRDDEVPLEVSSIDSNTKGTEATSTPVQEVDIVATVSPEKVATPTSPTTTLPPLSTGSYTLATVSTHNSSASCWTIVSGKVYDLTSFIGKHQGGKTAIKSLCGHDGTSAFEKKHDGKSRPEQTLAKYELGVLTQ
jgi:cytochrome b involved in lipid metabolism